MTLSNVCKTREVSDACGQNVILFLIMNPQRISLNDLPEIDPTSNVSAYAHCSVPQFFLTYDLYIAAFAGAGITLLALVSNKAKNRSLKCCKQLVMCPSDGVTPL